MNVRGRMGRSPFRTEGRMSSDVFDIARKLARIQVRLRKALLEELQAHAGDIESIFDPDCYSPLVHELREKYLNRLFVLQAIIHEFAHLNQGRRTPPVKVMTVKAGNNEELVDRVNEKLATLQYAKVLDVKFLQNKPEDDWLAVICFIASPFTETKDETAAWM